MVLPANARELAAADMAALQQFFEDNPEYFLAVEGRPPLPCAAQEEFDDVPPPGMTYSRKWMLGFFDPMQRMSAMAVVLSDFLAPGIWHIGLFITAASNHGTGRSQTIYAGLEQWIGENGAQWLRLGVVRGNVRAERFWFRQGYAEVRQRGPMAMGLRHNMLRVMVKPCSGQATTDYLAIVERDRPGVELP
jgi:hypothetical protein